MSKQIQTAAVTRAKEVVEAAMGRRKMTRLDLAKALRCKAPNVHQLLNGTRNYTVRTLAKMLDACGHDLVIDCRARKAADKPAAKTARRRPSKKATAKRRRQ